MVMVRGRVRPVVGGRLAPASGISDDDNEASAPRQARRRSELVLGASLVAAGVLGSLWLQQSGAEAVMVVGSSQALVVGRPIEAGDLVAVAVPRSIAGAFVLKEDASGLLGGSVRAPIASGDPIPRVMVTSQPVLGPDDVLVPALVEAGWYPPDLAPGDRVLLAVVPDPTMLEARPPVLVDEPVVVWAVQHRDDGSDGAIVTFAATARLALQLTGAGSLRVAIVGVP